MNEFLKLLRIDPNAKVPIATQLTNQFTWLIASGHIKPGDFLPRLRDLADQLGINMHTVRSAYQQLESDGLVEARRGIGTIVLSYDRERRSAHTPKFPTFTIGVLIPGYNPFYNPFLSAIEDEVRDSPNLIFIANTHNDALELGRYLDQLVAKNVDGIIVTSFGLPDHNYLPPESGSAHARPPIVFADIPGAPAPSILFDGEKGGYLAGSHLLDHGYKRIGLITCPVTWPNVGLVYQGFTRSLEERGIELPPELTATCQEFTLQEGGKAVNRLLDLNKPPDAIFVSGDMLAVGALQAISARNYRVPEDIALVGYDDSCNSGFTNPPITTIHLPAAEMGRRTISTLLDLIDGKEPDFDYDLLPVHLVVRNSCGCNPS